jgi:hypothetical protein
MAPLLSIGLLEVRHGRDEIVVPEKRPGTR